MIGDEPVTVLPNVENHVSLHIVGILERAVNLQVMLVDVAGIEPATPCLQRLVARRINNLAGMSVIMR